MDVSFVVYDDMRSQAEAMFSLDKGAVYCASTRKKIVTSSSRKSKLIGVVDIMLNILWCRHFMESQSYYAEDVYVYQDSQRAILLKTNERK